MTTTLALRADPTGAITTPEPATPATRWQRIALAVVLLATAAMYLWDITINGMGNQFYAGAAWAGSRNWEALLFGSLDPRNFITVDKPPLSQWVMGISGQIFGFSSASMLIPEALMAVGAVGLLYGAVSRISGRWAGLLAGAVLALTPVAVLMFRFNNPDAAMVLLMTLSAYCTVRALQHNGARWMAWAGVALGLAFLAKMLEGLMVMPAVGIAYAIAAPSPLRRRLLHLLGALVSFVVSSGWFVVLTLLWPASSRPYLAGSTDNSFMNLVLGYNGFARVLGHHTGQHPGGNQGVIGSAAGARVYAGASAHGGWGGFGAQTHGVARLFSGEFAFEIGWLVPAALLAIVIVIVARRHAPRTDLVRAGAMLFGGWLVIDGLVLSFMNTNIHPYYCLSIAPAVAAMIAIGVHELWRNRESRLYRLGLAVMILGTGTWSWWILGRNAGWLPPLRWTILALTVIASIPILMSLISRPRGRAVAASLVVGLFAAVAGPAAYAVATLGQAHKGGGPTVGPALATRGSGQPQFMLGQLPKNPQLDAMLAATHTDWSAAVDRSSNAASLELSSNTAVMAIGGFSGNDPVPTLSQFIDDVHNHKVAYYIVTNDHNPGRNRGHADIAKWVAAHYKPMTVGRATLYNLSVAT